jgi:hypothetical protein
MDFFSLLERCSLALRISPSTFCRTRNANILHARSKLALSDLRLNEGISAGFTRLAMHIFSNVLAEARRLMKKVVSHQPEVVQYWRH